MYSRVWLLARTAVLTASSCAFYRVNVNRESGSFNENNDLLRFKFWIHLLPHLAQTAPLQRIQTVALSDDGEKFDAYIPYNAE